MRWVLRGFSGDFDRALVVVSSDGGEADLPSVRCVCAGCV